jgi:hypothetical protein
VKEPGTQIRGGEGGFGGNEKTEKRGQESGSIGFCRFLPDFFLFFCVPRFYATASC